jgi:outer membrane protein TolC
VTTCGPLQRAYSATSDDGGRSPDLRQPARRCEAAGGTSGRENAFLPSLVVDAIAASRRTSSLHAHRRAAEGSVCSPSSFVTVNLSLPIWDWWAAGSHQSETRERQAQATLSQTQRQLVSNLYSKYNETLTARGSTDNLRRIVDLASESLRLLVLRYQAGESTILEVVDGQNTLVQARNAADDAETRYRVALADLQTLTGPF